MITAIMPAAADPVRLARSLASLVPAATEGVVSDVVLIASGADAASLAVADAAGCVILDAAALADPLAEAVSRARGEWLLLLDEPVPLPPEWQADAFAFIDGTMVGGTARRRTATFRGGRIQKGVLAQLRALIRGERVSARLVTKSAWLAGRGRPREVSAISAVSGARRGAA
jgi:hypothetical protein